MLSATKIKDYFFKKTRCLPHIEGWRCVRGRFEGAICAACKDSCLKNAVTINGIPVIDESLCEGCGICAKNCPTNAIRFDHPVVDGTFLMKEKAVFLCAGAKVNESVTDKISVPGGYANGTDYSFNALSKKYSEPFSARREVRGRQN